MTWQAPAGPSAPAPHVSSGHRQRRLAGEVVSLLVSGVWNGFAKLALPVVALAGLALGGGVSGGRLLAAAAGVAGLLGAGAVLFAVLHTEGTSVRTGQVAGGLVSALRRPFGYGPVQGWEHATATFRRRNRSWRQAPRAAPRTELVPET